MKPPTPKFVPVETKKTTHHPDPLLIGPVGEAPTTIFPKVAPSSKENKLPLKEPPPFRLNTRQGYNYKTRIRPQDEDPVISQGSNCWTRPRFGDPIYILDPN